MARESEAAAESLKQMHEYSTNAADLSDTSSGEEREQGEKAGSERKKKLDDASCSQRQRRKTSSDDGPSKCSVPDCCVTGTRSRCTTGPLHIRQPLSSM